MPQEPVRPRGLRVRRVDHVAINVRDLDQSTAFYGRILSLTPGQRSTFRQVLESPQLTLHLFQAPERRPAAAIRDWRQLGLQHVALTLDEAEFERAADVISAAGSAVEGPTEDREGRSLYLRDPDGNVIELRSVFEPHGGV